MPLTKGICHCDLRAAILEQFSVSDCADLIPESQWFNNQQFGNPRVSRAFVKEFNLANAGCNEGGDWVGGIARVEIDVCGRKSEAKRVATKVYDILNRTSNVQLECYYICSLTVDFPQPVKIGEAWKTNIQINITAGRNIPAV